MQDSWRMKKAGEQQKEQEEEEAKKRVPILIPSHEEVLQRCRPQQPSLLFRPSSASSPPPAPRPPPQPDCAPSLPNPFVQAFSFVKAKEFYSPPPPHPSPPRALNAAGAGAGTSGGRRLDEPQLGNIGQARNSILVSRRQQGNPVLKHIRNARWLFADIVPDYLLGQNSCALFLSLRYHLLHPDYIYHRIRELQKNFRLRVVLCYVDVEDVVKPLHEVTKTALLHDCTLICARSSEECARYLETLKLYENKPADDIQERVDHDYLSRLTSSLTTIRHVNKADVVTLASSFGTLASVIGASMEDLARCPGIGEKKVRRLYDAFHEPFRRKQTRLSSLFAHGQKEDIEARNQKSSISGEDSSLQNVADEPPTVSVRKALDVAYAKFGHKLTRIQAVNECNKCVSDEIIEGNKRETLESVPSHENPDFNTDTNID